jgi:GDP-4-dehydro-6-deoxy-D-mannose reductase
VIRVLVTGIGGFVGSHMSDFLISQEDVEVHGTILPGESLGNIAPIRDRLHLHEVEITDTAAVAKLMVDVCPEKVVHLAGQAFVPTSLHAPAPTFRVNIMGGVAVLDGARLVAEKRGVSPSVLLVSSGEVYGRVQQAAINEDTPLNPLNPYAVSKVALDLIGQDYRRTFNVHAVIARPFNHAGPRQSPSFVTSDFGRQFANIAVNAAPATVRVGDLNAKRDFTDVRDVVRAYWSLLTANAIEGVFNVCSGKTHEIREIVAMFQEISGVRVEIQTEPGRSREQNVPFMGGDYRRLREATGWEPRIPLRSTLQDVYDYWREKLSRNG